MKGAWTTLWCSNCVRGWMRTVNKSDSIATELKSESNKYEKNLGAEQKWMNGFTDALINK